MAGRYDRWNHLLQRAKLRTLTRLSTLYKHTMSLAESLRMIRYLNVQDIRVFARHRSIKLKHKSHLPFELNMKTFIKICDHHPSSAIIIPPRSSNSYHLPNNLSILEGTIDLCLYVFQSM